MSDKTLMKKEDSLWIAENMLINYGILAVCMVAGVVGTTRESQGWWFLCLLLAASVIFAWRRFRCPFCHGKIHWIYYRPGKCCPHCGAELDDDGGE